MTPKAGKAIAWCSFALGIAVSVAGNILHSAITPAGYGELVGAAFWPLALMLSIEILTRVRWQLGRWWMAARVVGLVLVGIVAAVLSYRHLAGLMTSWGEDPFNAHLGPLAVDGLMLLAATALLSISKEPKDFVAAPVPVVQETSQIVVLPGVWGAIDEPQGIDPNWAAINGWTPEPMAEELIKKAEEQVHAPVPDAQYEALEPSRLHIVQEVPAEATEEAARQAWIDSGRELSSSQVAKLANISKSTAHRRIKTWERQIVR